MARYRVTEASYIDGRLLQPGDEIATADGLIPGPHLTPLDDAARRAVKAAGPARMDRVDPVEAMTAQPRHG